MDDRELAEQAGYLPDSFGIGHWDMPECKRFAELIVKECAEVVNYYHTRNESVTPNQILQHFGIKS